MARLLLHGKIRLIIEHENSIALCNGNFFVIDWIKIYPFYYIHQNHLENPKKIDATEELEEILNIHRIPYKIKNGIFIIRGYNR